MTDAIIITLLGFVQQMEVAAFVRGQLTVAFIYTNIKCVIVGLDSHVEVHHVSRTLI